MREGEGPTAHHARVIHRAVAAPGGAAVLGEGAVLQGGGGRQQGPLVAVKRHLGSQDEGSDPPEGYRDVKLGLVRRPTVKVLLPSSREPDTP